MEEGSVNRTSTDYLQSTADQLMLEVRREKLENGQLSDDLMAALHFVFQQPLIQAFDLLDRNSVTHVVCPSGRELYRVQGSGSRVYTCLATSNYCSCPSFVYSVVVKEESLLCKHMLAVQLARAMDCYRESSVSDEDFVELLSLTAPSPTLPEE